MLEKVPLFVMAAAAGAGALVARRHEATIVSLQDLPVAARLANAATAYGWYLGHTFWPTRLAAFYPPRALNWSGPAVCAGAGVLLAGTAAAVWQVRRRPWLAVGWCWFVGALLPVIGLAQGGGQGWADRFTYWPHVGLFAALVWGLGRLVERFRVPAWVCGPVAALALGALAVLTWNQVGTWRDSVTLWERALAVSKDNPVAHLNLGKHFLEQRRPDTAEGHYAESVRLAPGWGQSHYGLGLTLLVLGREEEAARQFGQAAACEPGNVNAWHNRGTALLRLGEYDQAARAFRRVLELAPDSPDTLASLGLAQWRSGQRPEAVRTLRAALDANPDLADGWNGLGVAHLTEGRLAEAGAAFSRALAINPEMASSWSNLGLKFGRQGHWAEAVRCELQAVTLQEQQEAALATVGGRAPTQESLPVLVIYQTRLAFALRQFGNQSASDQVYREALRRDPTWPEKFAARARGLAQDPDPNRRDPVLACELAGQAAQATGEGARHGS
jgi:tetratricopeptide (TPR) repeat protein